MKKTYSTPEIKLGDYRFEEILEGVDPSQPEGYGSGGTEL